MSVSEEGEEQQLQVRVLWLQEEAGDLLQSVSRSPGEGAALRVHCDLLQQRQEVESLPAAQGLRGGTRLLFAGEEMQWTAPVRAFQEVRATQPTLKFVVSEVAGDRENERECGFFLLDLRSVPHAEEGGERWHRLHTKEQQEVKVNQLHGTTVLISAVLCPPAPPVPPRGGESGDVRASASSLAMSAIELPARYDMETRSGSQRRYAMSLSIVASRHLEHFLHSVLPNQQSSPVWLSWSILDVTLQSLEFDPSTSKPLEATTDTLFFQCSEVAMCNFLEELGNMRVFLCCPGNILGVAEIPFPRKFTHFPFQKGGWFTVQPLSQSDNEDSSAAVHMKLNVICTDTLPKAEGGDSDQLLGEEGISGNSGDDYDLDDYENESLHDEDENVGRVSTQSYPLLLLKGHGKSTGDVTPPLESLSYKNGMNNDHSMMEDEFEEHRFRICLQVKSLIPLHRPVRASVQFAYPHLGVGTAVRTHTAWSEANVETIIDGAVASFDCRMTKNRLRGIFENELFVIQVLSRSHLGVSKFGDASINLNKLNDMVPHSFICPLTSKAFKSLDQYREHRQLMIAMHGIGKVKRVPSSVPITLKTIDTYLPVLMTAGNKGVETVGKVRIFLTLEDFGSALEGCSNEKITVINSNLSNVPAKNDDVRDDGQRQEEVDFSRRKLEWEQWRQAEEEKWTAALREREQLLKQRLESEAAESLSQRADDLKRAQEEVGRLEVRLRSSIDLVERQKSQIELKEEQMNARLAQKTSELELLQRRVREEAKTRIDAENRRAVALESEVDLLKDQLLRATKRAEAAEKDYETYKNHVRSMPETSLREEASTLKAQLGDLRTEIERERRLRGETELEKEHYRSQMHRIAVALKREREKSSAIARQELEQLRLEFLSREERYILDGDRDELRTIRQELSSLRNLEAAKVQHVHHIGSEIHDEKNEKYQNSSHMSRKEIRKTIASPNVDAGGNKHSEIEKINRLNELRKELLSSELYTHDDPVIIQLDNAINQAEIHVSEGRISSGTIEDK